MAFGRRDIRTKHLASNMAELEDLGRRCQERADGLCPWEDADVLLTSANGVFIIYWSCCPCCIECSFRLLAPRHVSVTDTLIAFLVPEM